MSGDSRPRLFVVEDHDIVRFGIERLLEDRYQLVGSADEVVSAVELIRERNPDVVLLDVALPGGGGAVVVEAMRRTHPNVKFLAFTVSTSRQDVLRLMRAGAHGYVVKSTDRQQLAELIDQVLAGGIPISPEVAGHLLDIDDAAANDSTFARLTDREREVTTYIARGYTYREASAAMEMSVKTLETHLHHIFEKLGVRSRHELSQVAFSTGFVQPGNESARAPTGTVTFLLTDIVGAAKLWEEYPLLMPRVLARRDGLLIETLNAHHGWVVNSAGDGLLAVFERASSAVHAALSSRDRLADEAFGKIGRLSARMVLVTGEAEERDGDYLGPILGEAETILKICPPGEILASPVTRAVVGDSLPAGASWRDWAVHRSAKQAALPCFQLIRS